MSSQVGNIVLIDTFNVLYRFLFIVFFLRASCWFPAAKKTRSIPPPDTRVTMMPSCLNLSFNLRDVRNWAFFDLHLQLIEIKV